MSIHNKVVTEASKIIQIEFVFALKWLLSSKSKEYILNWSEWNIQIKFVFSLQWLFTNKSEEDNRNETQWNHF